VTPSASGPNFVDAVYAQKDRDTGRVAVDAAAAAFWKKGESKMVTSVQGVYPGDPDDDFFSSAFKQRT
jgi:hypothetical protein